MPTAAASAASDLGDEAARGPHRLDLGGAAQLDHALIVANAPSPERPARPRGIGRSTEPRGPPRSTGPCFGDAPRRHLASSSDGWGPGGVVAVGRSTRSRVRTARRDRRRAGRARAARLRRRPHPPAERRPRGERGAPLPARDRRRRSRRRSGATRTRIRDEPWVLGRGWLYAAFPGGMPTAAQLDAVVPDRPAWMSCFDGHTGWANTRRCAWRAIDRETPDPPAGVIVRDAEGNATGAFKEEAQALIDAVVPAAQRGGGPGLGPARARRPPRGRDHRRRRTPGSSRRSSPPGAGPRGGRAGAPLPRAR